MKRALAIIAIFCTVVTLTACGSDKKASSAADCISREGMVVDPQVCRNLQVDYSSHSDEPSWIQQYLLYQWAFGGQRQGNYYTGGHQFQVYDSAPSRVYYVSEDEYVSTTRRYTGVTPTTIQPRFVSSTAAPPRTQAPKVTASTKTTSAPKVSAPSSGATSTPKPSSSSSSSSSSNSSRPASTPSATPSPTRTK